MKRPFMFQLRGAKKHSPDRLKNDNNEPILAEFVERDPDKDFGSNDEDYMDCDAETPQDVYRGDDVDKLYMQETRKFPVLTHAQGVAVAKKIEAALKRRKVIRSNLRVATSDLESLSRRKSKSAKEKIGILRQNIARMMQEEIEAEAAINEARNEFVVHNLRLVATIAGKYLHRGLVFSDLVQEGNIGLMKAVMKFNWRLGYKFSTYATWWIRQSMTRALSESGRTVRIPVHIYDKIPLVMAARNQMQEKENRQPTPEEIAKVTGYPVHKVKIALEGAYHILSLEDIPAGHDSSLKDLLQDREYRIDGNLLEKRRKEDVRRILKQALDKRSCDVLKRRLGLNEYESDGEKTLEKVGSDYKLSRERIRQIEAEALKMLRREKWSRELRKHLPRET